MRIAVTGGSGQFGRQVIAELTGRGHEVLNLDRVPHPGGHRPTWICDLRDAGSLFQALRGMDAAVHLAAHVAPGLAPDTDTFNDNVATTYNLFRAASDCGVRRVVFASSIGAYGYLYGPLGQAPDWLPLDESHRCVPVDPYGLSKLAGERIAESFVAGGGMSAASLRLPGINYDPSFERIRGNMRDPGHRQRGFWSYVDVRDAALACRLALEADLAGHTVLNVAAPSSNMREPTGELIARFLPGLKDVRVPEGAPANWSGIDSRRAEALLGFRATHVWERAPAAR